MENNQMESGKVLRRPQMLGTVAGERLQSTVLLSGNLRMDIWNVDQTTLRERDSLLPFRKIFRLALADLRDAEPRDFESTSIRWLPIAVLCAFRCLCALYTTAVIVVSVFHYCGESWLSWLPFTVQLATGIYFVLGGIMSQVHYLILVCIRDKLCKSDRRSTISISDELPSHEGVTCSSPRETTIHNGNNNHMWMASVTSEESNESQEVIVGDLSIFHHIFWIFADVLPCVSIVITIIVISEDASIFKHPKTGVNEWYVNLNIYIIAMLMLITDFFLTKIPKRVTRLIVPCAFAFVFWIVTKVSNEFSTAKRQWLPPVHCHSKSCTKSQELYITIGVPASYCLFLLLHWLKGMIATQARKDTTVYKDWNKFESRWV